MRENELRSQPIAEVKSLKSLFQYQESSVVSRVLLKNPGGTVTLFAFGKGEGLSEHTAPFDALVIGVEGEAEIQISGQKHQLQEGETITMPANQPHAVQAASDFKMLLVMQSTPYEAAAVKRADECLARWGEALRETKSESSWPSLCG